MVISNQLQVEFSHSEIDNNYDFFIITTSDKYISGGAYVLDKPMDLLKAESVVFDGGRSLFIMFKKCQITKFELISQLIDEKLTIKQVTSEDIKDYILFRLFLYSLNNFESNENKFNNVAGKLYITRAKWIAKNKKTFKALNINVDERLCLTAEATTFTHYSCFTNKKILNTYPRYSFSNKNGGLKRSFDSEDAYIRKSLFGKKAEIPFFEFSKDKISDNKVYFIYKTLDLLQKKYEQCLSCSFIEMDKIKSIGKYRDQDFIEKCKTLLTGQVLNVVNWSNSHEFDDEFDSLLDLLRSKNIFNVKTSNKIEKTSLNLVYLHNKEYYEQNNYKDPYKNIDKESVTQHITIEDCSEKLINDNEAIFNSILKEFVIKEDLLVFKKISLDNWSNLDYSGRVVFGREKNDVHYFLIVNPDGTFDYKFKKNDFSSFKDGVLDRCSSLLTDNKGKEKSIIADDNGNIVIISRSRKYTLPSEKLFNLASISRSKESRERYLDGVVDINLFNNEGKLFYNAGIKGSGMNTSVPKASILYEVDVVEGNNIIESILETMSVPFVKYKNFTVMPYPFKYLSELMIQEENSR